MPVSTRTDRSPGGNALHAHPGAGPGGRRSPVERFAAIHERLAVTKTERAMGLTASLAGLGQPAAPPMLIRLARQQVMTVDFATSNVRAAPFDLYIAGAPDDRQLPAGSRSPERRGT